MAGIIDFSKDEAGASISRNIRFLDTIQESKDPLSALFVVGILESGAVHVSCMYKETDLRKLIGMLEIQKLKIAKEVIHAETKEIDGKCGTNNNDWYYCD
jgi:hypothetical protein